MIANVKEMNNNNSNNNNNNNKNLEACYYTNHNRRSFKPSRVLIENTCKKDYH